MSLQKAVWHSKVVEQFFAKNAFLNYAADASEFVMDGKIVYIPQAGDPSAVEINRTQLPAAIEKRTDDFIFYALDEFTTNPRLLTRTEGKWLSYNKLDSMVRTDFANMREWLAKMILYRWAENIASARKYKTTGTTTHTATAPGATGSRKNLIVDDFQLMQAAFDAEDVPEESRYALIESNCYGQLMKSMTEAQRYAFKDGMDLQKGVVGELYGFNIIKRSKVLVADSSDGLKHPTAAAATGDNVANLFWQMDSVEKAIGDLELLDDKGNPVFYGDIHSIISYAGGRATRKDGKGVALLLADA